MAGVLVVRRAGLARGQLAFRALVRPWERLRGLLGTDETAAPVALLGCGSVHTFGMRYRIDVAFVGAAGIVVDVRRGVPPGRLLGHRRACLTLERPHTKDAWLVPGEQVFLERREES